MYFKLIKDSKSSNVILFLKYSINLDNIEVQREIIQKTNENKNYIIDLFVNNGFNSNRYFEIVKVNNKVSYRLYKGDCNILTKKTNLYLEKNIDLILNSSLSSYEINKLLMQIENK